MSYFIFLICQQADPSDRHEPTKSSRAGKRARFDSPGTCPGILGSGLVLEFRPIDLTMNYSDLFDRLKLSHSLSSLFLSDQTQRGVQ